MLTTKGWKVKTIWLVVKSFDHWNFVAIMENRGFKTCTFRLKRENLMLQLSQSNPLWLGSSSGDEAAWGVRCWPLAAVGAAAEEASVADVDILPPLPPPPVELLPQMPALPMKRLNGLLEPARPDESPWLLDGNDVLVSFSMHTRQSSWAYLMCSGVPYL